MNLWPRRYRGKHRHTPEPAQAAWLDMQRVPNLDDPATQAEIAWLEELFAKDTAE